MQHTRERIMLAALELFGREGYAGTSMSDIAAELGVTKGALYRHYPGKRAILESIIARMEQGDREQAATHEVPEDSLALDAQSYAGMRPEDICAFSLAQLKYWREDSFAAPFRRMLCIERYSDGEMERLYQNYLGTGPLGYMKDIFSVMQREGRLAQLDAELLALEFYGPMYLLLDTDDSEALLAAHMERFFERYLIKREG